MSFYTVQRCCYTALPTVRTRAHYRISGTISHDHNAYLSNHHIYDMSTVWLSCLFLHLQIHSDTYPSSMSVSNVIIGWSIRLSKTTTLLLFMLISI